MKVTLWSHLVNSAILGWFPNSVKMIRLWSMAQPPPEARDTPPEARDTLLGSPDSQHQQPKVPVDESSDDPSPQL